MSPLRVLLFVLVLTLLGVLVESGTVSSGSKRVRGPKLWKVYNSKVYLAEWMIRPLTGLHHIMGEVSHSGVRVTLVNGDQWLIHKGPNYGSYSDTVVVSADTMGPMWRQQVQRKYFGGRKTVRDFVRAGGRSYDLIYANCHHAAKAMMSL